MTKEYDKFDKFLNKLENGLEKQKTELSGELVEIAKRKARVDALKELTDRMSLDDTAIDIFRLATVMTDEIRKGF